MGDIGGLKNILGKRFDVMGDEKGWIELVDIMPHPESGVSGDLAIVNAARVSFLGESKGEDADKKLLFYLLRNHHTSPFEMVEFKFRVRAPVVTFWQWVRHRTWNINAQSGRYTPFEEDDFYVPPADKWRKQSVSNKQGSSGEFLSDDDFIATGESLWYNDDTRWLLEQGESQDFSSVLRNYQQLGFKLYKMMLDAGAAKEQARLFLPGWALYYTWVMKIDAHNLMKFLQLRMDPHAQWEIRVYADVIYEQIFKSALPWTAEAFELYVLKSAGE